MNNLNWEEIRREFPVFKDYIYLNPAGGSPISAMAAKAAKHFYDEMLAQGDNPYEEWLERTEIIRGTVASYIGANQQEIAFTTNTSHGMNLIALMNRNKGVVLSMSDEFPSSTVPWLNQGFKIKMVEPDNGFEYSIEKIENSIEADTKIILTSYVQYRTGFRQDLEALGKLCKEQNLIFVVNATQAIPVFPIDVRKCNIDFLVFTGLKWATAGYGIGGLYINEKWIKQDKMPFAGWLSVENPEEVDNLAQNIEHRASVVESGCPHFAPIFALGGAMRLFNKVGNEHAAKRVLYLTNYLHEQLRNINVEIASPTELKNMSGITIIKMVNAQDLVAKLKEEKIIVSARGAGLRVSVNIFNNEHDIDRLIQALTKYHSIF